MGKVSAVAKLTVNPDKADDFPAAWDDMFAHIAANEPGTEHYVLHRSTSEPTVFFMTEIYENQAALDAHGSSDAMAKVGASLGEFVEGVELHFLEPIKSAKGVDL
jgi:quinol monooxygenase YgiN